MNPEVFGKSSQDPLLRAGSVWAQRMMAWAQGVPPERRGPELEAALNRLHSGLGSTVKRVGDRMLSEGMMPDKALHRALQYGFADAFSDSILQLGRDAAAGRKIDKGNMLVATPKVAGVAGLGTASTTTTRTPEQITGDIVSGVVCSDGVASLVGAAGGVNDTTKQASDRQLAAGLTEVGFLIARGVSGAVGHPCASGTAAAPPAPPAPPAPATPDWLIPAAIGGAVLVGVGVLVVALR
jgi:hypothetical protein